MSRRRVDGGDADALIGVLERCRRDAQARVGRPVGVECVFEAGYDGSWLQRRLARAGLACRGVDPASPKVDRRACRAKTDPVDVACPRRRRAGRGSLRAAAVRAGDGDAEPPGVCCVGDDRRPGRDPRRGPALLRVRLHWDGRGDARRGAAARGIELGAIARQGIASPATQAVRASGPVLVEHRPASDSRGAFLKDHDVASSAATVVRGRKQAFGVLSAHSRRFGAFGGVVRADVLPAQHLADAHNMAGKLAACECVGGAVGSLSHMDAAEVTLGQFHADAETAHVANRDDRGRYSYQNRVGL